MRINANVRMLVCLLAALPALADVIILHDGSSYSGRAAFSPGPEPEIHFTGSNGVGFTFPVRDVQSLVFTPAADTITLRNGRSYTGHYGGEKQLHFAGSEGIAYDFPLRDISSVVFSAHPQVVEQSQPKSAGAMSKVIPEGTQLSITTNERIDSKHASDGQLFRATIAAVVSDSVGATAIPAGTPAKLVVRRIQNSGALHTPELVLDLFSVEVGGHEYRTNTAIVVERGRETVGANRRTAEYAGGGTGLGALLGGIFGGGNGAGIGALAGAGGGALTELFTRGEDVKVPAEATLTFRLDHTLVLRP